LADIRYAAARGPLSPALVKSAPDSLKNDPGLLFARVQDARRSNRAYEAATLLSLAPADHDALVSPDRWWSERRMVARELLDINEPRLALALCANAAKPDESANEVDREFHAGWIALRFLGNASEAAQRFALAAVAAETPLSIARAEYWRGRAAEAMGDGDEATLHYQNAATQPVAYYGQLAAERLGLRRLALRAPERVAERAERNDAVGAVVARRSADCGDGRGGQAPRRRGDPGPVRQDRDAARLRLRRHGLSGDRRAGLPAARPFGRPRQRLRGRAAGERVRLARRFGRWREGAHADPAFDRCLDRPAGWGRLRHDAAHRRSRLQHPARRRVPRTGDGGRGRLARHGLRRL